MEFVTKGTIFAVVAPPISAQMSKRFSKVPRSSLSMALLLLLAAGCARNRPIPVVAVADFEGEAFPYDKKPDFLSHALAGLLVADLRASGKVRIVDRQHLAEMLCGQKALGVGPQNHSATGGTIVGAKYFIFGNYIVIENQVIVSARMVSVETSEIVESKSLSGNLADIRALSRQLSAVFVSRLVEQLAQRQ